MSDTPLKKRIWGWMMYDWATQPYHTLIITFVFAPYFAEMFTAKMVASGLDLPSAKASAQAYWGWVVSIAGLLIAFSAPVLGAVADSRGSRMPFIWFFSLVYLVGSIGLWTASPTDFPALQVAIFFAVGLIGLELTTVFTNALLPNLGSREEIGRVSGNGWAWGYVGGFFALLIMLLLFVENAEGKTFLGSAPAFGFDPEAREGTRFVGPFTALWFALSMIPFALWVREPRTKSIAMGTAVGQAISELRRTLATLPSRPSLFAFLGSSMFYRDALNGVFTFGGVYAFGVLGWQAQDMGVFGIIGIISGTLFAYLGGKADMRWGPKPVIRLSIIVLICVCLAMLFITRESVLLMPVADGSALPDIAFYVCGAVLGAVGGVIQSASRTMMVRQSDPKRMTEAFGLFALSGKATAFLAPMLVAIVTTVTGSQRLGILPLIGLFVLGLVLLRWVTPEGEPDVS